MDVVILLAALGALALQARRLPIQNILAIAGLIFGISFCVEQLVSRTAMPFSQSLSVRFPQEKTIGSVPWPIPFLWISVLLLLRSLAKVLLRGQRRTGFYGSKLLLLTSLLTAIVYSVPMFLAGSFSMADGLGVFISAAFILFILTPWLIEKRPTPEP